MFSGKISPNTIILATANVLSSLVPVDLHCDCIYFYTVRKKPKEAQTQHRLSYKGQSKFCATSSEYFIHVLVRPQCAFSNYN